MSPVVAWCFFDGKPGHENQVLGLINALGDLATLNPYFFQVRTSLVDWSLGRFPSGDTLPDPDLLVGAGHGTHIPLLTARRARGGHIVLLMNPSLPRAWFDLCVVPEHDQVPASAGILVSRGTLSRVRPSERREQERGLILIGGPSRNHGWSDAAVIQQVRAILARNTGIHWVLTNSRRTPPSFLRNLSVRTADPNGTLEVVPWTDTGPEWVLEQLSRARRAWVTEESVSMVYDALTAGSEVGLIAVPRRRLGRVARGVQRLVEDGLVTPFETWNHGQDLKPTPGPFNEAARCAEWIRNRWLGDR